MKNFLIVFIYLCFVAFNYGALYPNELAFEKGLILKYPGVTSYSGENAKHVRRKARAMASIFSIIGPFGLPISIFCTNFLEDGWCLNCDPPGRIN